MYLANGKELIVSPHTSEDNETVLVHFGSSATQAVSLLDENGIMPLPPYIKAEVPTDLAEAGSHELARQRYQTVFHQVAGSVAAPTAGLHFTPELLKTIVASGHEFCSLTLHVGLGTFAPIRSDDPQGHIMHEEFYKVPSQTITQVLQARKDRRPIFFVGTTSFRAMESYFLANPTDQAALAAADHWQSTRLFVFPKFREDIYRPYLGSGIITNFHLPESSLYMLISALIGMEQTRQIYETAIDQNYRFFSYGDANLLYFPGKLLP
jgi:S-adenosylmethionine:tRNA ribosyltransferase-isomerase